MIVVKVHWPQNVVIVNATNLTFFSLAINYDMGAYAW
jgi:hypothetical protein